MSSAGSIPFSFPTPEEWQRIRNLHFRDVFMTDQELFDRHQKTFNGLDADMRTGMVACIREAIPTDPVERQKWRDLLKKEPLTWWWHGHHHGVGTAVRNLLRQKGFDDSTVRMNLDDVWVPIFEAAVLDTTFRATLKEAANV